LPGLSIDRRKPPHLKPERRSEVRPACGKAPPAAPARRKAPPSPKPSSSQAPASRIPSPRSPQWPYGQRHPLPHAPSHPVVCTPKWLGCNQAPVRKRSRFFIPHIFPTPYSLVGSTAPQMGVGQGWVGQNIFSMFARKPPISAAESCILPEGFFKKVRLQPKQLPG